MLLLFGACGSKKNNLKPITGFDVNKYTGTWHEIARLPNSFEKNLVDVTAQYQLEGNRLRVINSGLDTLKNNRSYSKGIAKFVGNKQTAELKVSFFRPFFGAYKVIRLEPDYSIALVVSDNYKYLWILARTKTIPQEKLNEYLAFIKQAGFDTQKLIIFN